MATTVEAQTSTPFMTEHQAATRLGLSPKTLRNWRSDGTGPSYLRLGATVRYHVEHLDAWALGNIVVVA